MVQVAVAPRVDSNFGMWSLKLGPHFRACLPVPLRDGVKTTTVLYCPGGVAAGPFVVHARTFL